MKFRTDFVTNSSSTNFAAAAVEIIAVLVASGLFASCKCSEADQGDYGIELSFNKEPLTADGKDEVWVYGKVISEKDEKAGRFTPAINFSLSSEYKSNVYITDCQMNGEYKAGKITAVSPDGFQAKTTEAKSINISAEAAVDNGTANGSKGLSVEFLPSKNIIFATDQGKDGKIQIGSDKTITLFAQIQKKDEQGNDVVDEEATNTINIDIIGEAIPWVKLGEQSSKDGWIMREASGINPNGKDVEAAKIKPPEKANIQLTATLSGKPITQNEELPIAAQPKLSFTPDYKVYVVKDSGTAQQTKIQLLNAGTDNWAITYDADSFTSKICTVEEVPSDASTNGDTSTNPILTLNITDNDTEDVSNQTIQYYSKGKINIKAASQGDQEPIEDYMEVTLVREGLSADYLDLRTTCLELDASGEDGDDRTIEATNFGLKFIKYDGESKTFTSDADIAKTADFSDPEPEEDEKSQNVFDVYKDSIIEIAYADRTTGGNLPTAIFSAQTSCMIPGKPGEVYKAKIEASVTYNNKYYSTIIPVQVKPDTSDYQEELSEKEKEYDYCVQTINKWVPVNIRSQKLNELNSKKESWGAQDIFKFRKECWNIAYNAIMQEKKAADDWAWWMDQAVTTCNIAAFIGDKTFSALMSSFTGPFGAYVAGQLKDGVIDLAVKWQESSKTGWDFFFDYACSRTKGLVSKGIDTTIMKEPADLTPEKLLGWFVSFYIYKTGWHWYFDMKGKDRAGFVAALESAALDVVGVGLKRGLESFIKESMTEQGLSKFGESFGSSINDKIKDIRKIGEGNFDSAGKSIMENAEKTVTAVLDWLAAQSGGYSVPLGKQ